MLLTVGSSSTTLPGPLDGDSYILDYILDYIPTKIHDFVNLCTNLVAEG